jgi:hypothetical protein
MRIISLHAPSFRQLGRCFAEPELSRPVEFNLRNDSRQECNRGIESLPSLVRHVGEYCVGQSLEMKVVEVELLGK